MGQTETSEGELKWKVYDLDFSVHKSRRYHDYLRAFYEGWRDRMKIVTVVSGSGAFLLITADFENVAKFVTAFVALWAVIDIVVSPDKKANLHADLTRGFTMLARKLATAPLTESGYSELQAERLHLEHDDDSPCKRLVDLQARNDECRARGFPADALVPLSKWQRVLGYYMTFGMGRLEAWKASRQQDPL